MVYRGTTCDHLGKWISEPRCLVGVSRIYTVGAEVQSDLTTAAVEGVTSATLAALSGVDGGEQSLELATGQRGVRSGAAVDGGAFAVGTRGEAVVDSAVRESVEGCGADAIHPLVAAAGAIAVVGEAED